MCAGKVLAEVVDVDNGIDRTGMIENMEGMKNENESIVAITLLMVSRGMRARGKRCLRKDCMCVPLGRYLCTMIRQKRMFKKFTRRFRLGVGMPELLDLRMIGSW